MSPMKQAPHHFKRGRRKRQRSLKEILQRNSLSLWWLLGLALLALIISVFGAWVTGVKPDAVKNFVHSFGLVLHS